MFSALADSTKFFADLPIALTNFCVLADSAKKYKMVIFKPKHKLLEFFGLVPKSPTHAGLICVKTPKPNISCLGSFN